MTGEWIMRALVVVLGIATLTLWVLMIRRDRRMVRDGIIRDPELLDAYRRAQPMQRAECVAIAVALAAIVLLMLAKSQLGWDL